MRRNKRSGSNRPKNCSAEEARAHNEQRLIELKDAIQKGIDSGIVSEYDPRQLLAEIKARRRLTT